MAHSDGSGSYINNVMRQSPRSSYYKEQAPEDDYDQQEVEDDEQLDHDDALDDRSDRYLHLMIQNYAIVIILGGFLFYEGASSMRALWSDPTKFIQGNLYDRDYRQNNQGLAVPATDYMKSMSADFGQMDPSSQLATLKHEVDWRAHVQGHPAVETTGRYQEVFTWLGLSHWQKWNPMSKYFNWPPAIATVDRWSYFFSIALILWKLLACILFVMGSRPVAKYLLYCHFPLRQIVYFNIFAGVNQPPAH